MPSKLDAVPYAFNWFQGFWGAVVASLGYLPREQIGEVLKASPYNVASVTWAEKGSDYGANVAFVDTGSVAWVGIEGTTNFVQWLSYVLKDGFLYPFGDARGIFKVFREIGFGASLDIKLRVPQGKPLVLCGHSLGGAAACVAAEILAAQGWNVLRVMTFGQPKTGNAAWAAAFPLTVDRIFQHADVVPKVPLTGAASDLFPSTVFQNFLAGNWTSDRIMAHCGESIELDEPGSSDDVSFYMKGLQGLGIKTAGVKVSSHFMGNYVGLMYQRLNDDGKQFWLSAAEELQRTESLNLFDAAFPARSASVSAVAPLDVRAEEIAFARSLLGVNSRASIRLFQGAYVAPARGQLPALTEASFPGYAPKKPPVDAAVSGGYPEAVSIGPVVVKWTCEANLSPAQMIGGVYTTYVHDDGIERPVEVWPFVEPIRIKDAGQEVAQRIQAKIAKTGP